MSDVLTRINDKYNIIDLVDDDMEVDSGFNVPVVDIRKKVKLEYHPSYKSSIRRQFQNTDYLLSEVKAIERYLNANYHEVVVRNECYMDDNVNDITIRNTIIN